MLYLVNDENFIRFLKITDLTSNNQHVKRRLIIMLCAHQLSVQRRSNFEKCLTEIFSICDYHIRNLLSTIKLLTLRNTRLLEYYYFNKNFV